VTDAVRDEPVLDAAPAPRAGSLVPRDIARAVACAALVAGCVAAPDSAPLLAPFVPALVAIRLLRTREHASRFLVGATLSSLAAVVSVAADAGVTTLPVAVGAAGLLVVFLGLVHARAARHDPVDTAAAAAWPEPRIDTGLSLTVGAWSAAMVLVVLLLVPRVDSLVGTERSVVVDAYSGYVRNCEDGGALESRTEFCDGILEQRQSALDLVDERAPELLAVVMALFAFGAAATAHLVVLMRARRTSTRIRRAWRIVDLEVHWSAAYLVALGIVAWLATQDATGGNTWLVGVRAVGVGIGTLGALLLLTQGLGLAAWVFARGRSSRWYRGAVVVLALLVVPVTLLVLFALGVLDMALHPRRKALESGSVPRRGSGN